HSLGKMICFCPTHMERLSRRVGRKVTREEVKEALLCEKFEQNVLRQSYFDEAKDNTESLFRFLADSVHKVSPETEIGIMTTTYPVVTLDKDLSLLFEENKDRKIRRIRTGMDFYREGEHNKIPLAFTMPAIQKLLIGNPEVEIQPEIENDTYGYFYKSNAVTHMQIVWCLAGGFRNCQLNLFEFFAAKPQNYEEITDFLTAKMPFYNALADLIPCGSPTEGVGIYVHPRAMCRNRSEEGEILYEAAWHGYLQFMGIPYASDYRSAKHRMITQDDVVSATDEEIRFLLSGGAVIDLRGAEALLHRGFGNEIGVRAISPLRGVLAGERFTDARENGEWKNCHNSDYLMSTLVGESLVKDVTYRDGARQLSYLIDHNGQKIANGVTLTQNDKGIQFCILP
ncbi:MAG: hypothetical protein MJ078_07895, partial [Clostridia bacterium]|nr:hypothetical protein [Clostridia bacterium]